MTHAQCWDRHERSLRRADRLAGAASVHCAKTLLYDSVFYSVYLSIHLKYTHQRIEPYTQVRIFKYNQSRDICGCLANR